MTEQTASDVIQKALETVLVFANAHLAIRHENALAVYAAVAASRSVAPLVTCPPLTMLRQSPTFHYC